MNSSINAEILYNIDAHAKRLRFLYRIKGFGYERAIELPLLAEKLQSLFDKPLRYLDIGTGPSIFPSWVASKTNWDVTCLDKFDWVNKQNEYAKKLGLDPKRFHVVVRDFLEAELEPESFDVITNISVIEHFEGALDSVAMEKSARLLKPGGIYLLTTPAIGIYNKTSTVKSLPPSPYSSNAITTLNRSTDASSKPPDLPSASACILATTKSHSSMTESLTRVASIRSSAHSYR